MGCKFAIGSRVLQVVWISTTIHVRTLGHDQTCFHGRSGLSAACTELSDIILFT